MSEKYLLDANVFIEAHRRYYAFDIAPSFWTTLQKLAEDEKIISIDRVKGEIIGSDQEDLLGKWANDSFSKWFMSTDDEKVFDAFGQVINWAQTNEQFHESAKSEFASVADSWLVAYAKAYNLTVVTHEEFKREIKKRILIPNVCRAFEIPYINTFEMLRRLNARI
ncbi:DUF4411 family protein [Aquibacillus sp. 3ASR75-11]|uniref:DUF4411 family protein n=1 Tax=Terrihalobacillus insolitus TaxID=2950438 RepID=A0A9X4AL39_9BACI|nr:DUF4411 family protein [Terrihalobacillus insolitus]MDC3411862.1 DUF4411 family protein [Terrihalobacillus insolitus]MDC3423459.1 DUF4411 family protein [Terrihalobacillus insolitus]